MFPAIIDGLVGLTVMLVRTAVQVCVVVGADSPSLVAPMVLVPVPGQSISRVAVSGPMEATEGVPLVKTALAVTF